MVAQTGVLPVRTVLVDTEYRPDLVEAHVQGALWLSTNPIATLSLRRFGLDPTPMEDFRTSSDLMAVQSQVVRLVQGLRLEWDTTDLAAVYPNPFQVHSYHLTALFFSLLIKQCELERVLEQARRDREGEGFANLFITDREQAGLPSYPLREDDAVYAWLLGRLFTLRHPGLKWNKVCAGDAFSGDVELLNNIFLTLFQKSRALVINLKRNIKFCIRTYTVLRHLLQAHRPVQTASVVLGWRHYDVSYLSDRLLREWGLVWRQPDDILTPDFNEIHVHDTDFAKNHLSQNREEQATFEAEVRRFLHQVLVRELRSEQFDILKPIIGPVTASMKSYTAQCAILDTYLARTNPIVFVSPKLSGSLSDRLLALLCRRRGIPVIGLSHGGGMGDLAEGSAKVGIHVYLDEMELCNIFIAWGAGSAEALAQAQTIYRPESDQPSVVAGSSLSIPSPTKNIPTIQDPRPSIARVLYVAHHVLVNIERMAWLRGRYVDYVISMCDLLSRLASPYRPVVKLPPTPDRWQEYLYHHLAERYPQLELIRAERSVSDLAREADFVIIDVPHTTLCEVLPLPVHIATVETMAGLYSGVQMMKLESLELLRRRCVVAPTHIDLLSVVKRRLENPEQADWPDVNNHDYFYRFVKNSADITGYEAYERVLFQMPEKHLPESLLRVGLQSDKKVRVERHA